MVFRPEETLYLSYGICGPATCSPTMLIEVFTEALQESHMNNASDVTIEPNICQKQTEQRLDTTDILAM